MGKATRAHTSEAPNLQLQSQKEQIQNNQKSKENRHRIPDRAKLDPKQNGLKSEEDIPDMSEAIIQHLIEHNYALKDEDVDGGMKRKREEDEGLDDKRIKCENVFENINYDKYNVELPKNRFKNVLEALPYLLKRLPIITNLANEIDYKCTYPYAAKNSTEYSNWPLEKKLSSEVTHFCLSLSVYT